MTSLDQGADTGPDEYLRAECDNLLHSTEADSQEETPTDPDGLLGQRFHGEGSGDALDSSALSLSAANLKSRQRKAFFVRILALLCACSLSIGSH